MLKFFRHIRYNLWKKEKQVDTFKNFQISAGAAHIAFEGLSLITEMSERRDKDN
jgi:hypothetical protein